MSEWPKDVPLSRERWREKHSDGARRTQHEYPDAEIISEEHAPDEIVDGRVKGKLGK